ncbi:MAG: YcxB family protein [Oscillospiraceae bacterium]|nr:YcxB family protein [Oscillospiraceae bacterium]
MEEIMEKEVLQEETPLEQNEIYIEYDQTPQEVDQALHKFQKKTIYKKNYLYTGLLVVLAILYILQVIKNPEYTQGVILLMVCIVVLGAIWILPYNHRRKVKKAVENVEVKYSIKFTSEKMVIPSREQGVEDLEIYFKDNQLEALETDTMFIMMLSRQTLFALPKRCLTSEQVSEVSAILEEGLRKLYCREGE